MKITCISDCHGQLPETVPEGDILIVAGDLCPANDHSNGNQRWWLKNRFNLWLDTLPFDKEHVVCIAGNHDWIFDRAPHMVPDLDCHYLQDSGVTIDGLKFYGYPHTPEFCSWAFNCRPKELEVASGKIPDDTDVLVTHGPPYGILDTVSENVWAMHEEEDKHLGDKNLRERVDNMPDLKLHVFGHIHSGHGIVGPTSKCKTTFVNAAHLNERYDPDYDITVVDV
jgi:Icc-related predicted phosphoesterase